MLEHAMPNGALTSPHPAPRPSNPPLAPATPAGRALRRSANGSGIGAIAAAPAAPGSMPLPHTVSALTLVEALFPHASAAIRARHEQPRADASAWLLPSATAAPASGRKGHAHRHPHPPHPKPAATSAVKGMRRPGFSARRVSAPATLSGERRGARPGQGIGKSSDDRPRTGPAEARVASRVAATGQAISQPKEVLLGPVNQLKQPAVATASEDRPPQLPLMPVKTHTDDLQQNKGVNPLSRPPSPQRADMTPRCIRFHGLAQTIRQVRKARHAPEPLNYCVPSSNRGLFNAAMETMLHDDHGRDLWLVTSPVEHSIDTALRQLPVYRYSGLDEWDYGQVPTASPLGDSAVITPLTVSLLGEHETRRHVIADAARLSRNSFRILSHTDLAGTERLFLAYFTNREQGRHPGVSAGHIELFRGHDGRIVIEDAVAGMQFSADSLAAMVARLQELTGCRYLSHTDGDTGESTWDDTRVQSLPARSLFVDREETLSAEAPHPHLAFNQAQDFFDSVAVTLHGREGVRLLYRNSFILHGATFFYVDAVGRSGRLEIRPSAHPDQPGPLHCPSWDDLLLAERLGLSEGRGYSAQQILDALLGADMLLLEHPPVLGGGDGWSSQNTTTVSAP